MVEFTYSRSHAFRYGRRDKNDALSRIVFTTSSLVSMQGYPLDHSGDEVHQSIHDIFVHRESRVGYVYQGRKEDVEEEGFEHPPLANILLHNEPTTSDTLCITYSHSIKIVGVGKERRTKRWPMVKPEKAAPVTGTTTLRATGPVSVDSR